MKPFLLIQQLIVFPVVQFIINKTCSKARFKIITAIILMHLKKDYRHNMLMLLTKSSLYDVNKYRMVGELGRA